MIVVVVQVRFEDTVMMNYIPGSILGQIIYILLYFFLPFHWPRAHHMTCKQLPTYKCFAANNILLMCNY